LICLFHAGDSERISVLNGTVVADRPSRVARGSTNGEHTAFSSWRPRRENRARSRKV